MEGIRFTASVAQTTVGGFFMICCQAVDLQVPASFSVVTSLIVTRLANLAAGDHTSFPTVTETSGGDVDVTGFVELAPKSI